MSNVSDSPTATARAPRRKRGELRVAALLEAAASVFAERGYAAATMTEIAARAQAPIGSLYQFFPNKEALAGALMARYLEAAVAALTAIEARAATLSTTALAAALVRVFVDLQQERAVAASMLDAMPGRRESAAAFRATMLAHIGRILKARTPALEAARTAPAALTVLLQLKSAAALEMHAADAKAHAAALRELQRMLALYLDAL